MKWPVTQLKFVTWYGSGVHYSSVIW